MAAHRRDLSFGPNFGPEAIDILVETVIHSQKYLARGFALKILSDISYSSGELVKISLLALKGFSRALSKSVCYDFELGCDFGSAAKEFLENLSNFSPSIIEELFNGIKNDYISVRGNAFITLSHIPNPSTEIIQAFLQGMKDVHSVREIVIEGLGNLAHKWLLVLIKITIE